MIQATPAQQHTLSLDELAAEADKQLGEFAVNLRESVLRAKLCGDALRAAKAEVGHGKWLQWLEANFKASAETARVFMRVSKFWEPAIRAAYESQPQLTLEQVRHMLRPEPDRDNGVAQSGPDYRDATDMCKQNIFGMFRNWLDFVPDEGILVLHDNWQDLMAAMLSKLRIDLGIATQEEEDRMENGHVRRFEFRRTDRHRDRSVKQNAAAKKFEQLNAENVAAGRPALEW